MIGTLFRASQFLSEELPIRLAHRVQELGDLPDGLNEMPSIKRVQDWYAQSFEVCYGNIRVRRLTQALTCERKSQLYRDRTSLETCGMPL